jgi:trk system potassium uptake protein TrkA
MSAQRVYFVASGTGETRELDGTIMRALIAGAGNAGWRLAERLCAEGHEVVLVDQNQRRLDEVASSLDLLTVCGNAASLGVLEEAQLSKAVLFAAVTDHDEVNILAALFAHQIGVRHTVARVSSSDYLAPHAIEGLTQMGIDLIVNEHDECAREIQMVLNMPGSREVIELVQGRILCVGLTQRADGGLSGMALRDYAAQGMLNRVRLLAVMRQGKLLIPDGALVIEPQDIVYCIGQTSDVRAFVQDICGDCGPVEKVVIAGGGDTGLHLARRLERTDRQVVLIEKDETRAQEVSAFLGRTLVMHGSALDRQLLDQIGVDSSTTIVAAMGHDENNILSALLAKKAGARFGVSIVSNPSYVQIINDDHLLDRAVSPYLTTINAILRFLRGTNIRSVNLLHNVPGELLQVDLPVGSRWRGVPIHKLKLSKRAILAMVLRGDEAIIPTGNTELEVDDRLFIFVPQGTASKVEALFRQ